MRTSRKNPKVLALFISDQWLSIKLDVSQGLS